MVDCIAMGKAGAFRYVYIPADVSEPLQELGLSYTEEDQVQCLLHKLRVGYSCGIPQHKGPLLSVALLQAHGMNCRLCLSSTPCETPMMDALL